MTWKFETIQSATPTVSGSTYINKNSILAHDGRDIWVSGFKSTPTDSKIFVYGYWDQNSQYEYLGWQYYFDENTSNPLYLYNTIDVGTKIVKDMVYWSGKMYVLLDDNTINIYDVTTKSLITTKTPPVTVQPRLIAANNKIWMVSIDVTTTDQQVLHWYNILTNTWGSNNILGRKQDKTRDMVDGYDGYLYITSMNNHAIVKVDTTTGAMMTWYSINRHPYKLMATQDKDVYIASDSQWNPPKTKHTTTTTWNSPYSHPVGGTGSELGITPIAFMGMVSKMNQTTYDVTHASAACGTISDFSIDPTTGYMWSAYKWKDENNPTYGLGRTNTTNNDFRYTHGSDNGSLYNGDHYTIEGPGINPMRSMLIPSFTYQKWNGSGFDNITVHSYLVNIQGTSIFAIRLNSMVRENWFSVLGTGMIGTGDQLYIGDES